ncbi:PREDICTED: biogenesis of lysosome-related organelles complex 1 subunit 3 [Ceratosolen solmsi marchali]|uniref:Biogenesis of lysosome-related organelles complex 1 subunit 3 n=1 Tax=Ceratosolen solmsi marchali TaxID=326594 RepID=A0AAJ6YWH0_9HYME|nr:PREDICTED: biogenesis of lysosome-related organelles complex 1 subunit 3 [Ceratosolen solmsi marchali]
MESKAVIVSGEASESDEESINVKMGIPFPLLLASTSCGTMIQGEAGESDDENNGESNANYADTTTCSYKDVKAHRSERSSVKYNSLLHKKLRDCNKSLDRNIREFFDNNISNGMAQLVDTNKQLLKSQFILQDTVSKFLVASTQFEDTLNTLENIVEEDFFRINFCKK